MLQARWSLRIVAAALLLAHFAAFASPSPAALLRVDSTEGDAPSGVSADQTSR